MCVLGIYVHGLVSEIETRFEVKVCGRWSPEMQLCATSPFWKWSNLSKWGFHATATVPIVGVYVHRGIVCSYPFPSPLCAAPAAHSSGASGPPLGPAVGTGKSWDTVRLAQNQEVFPSGFLLRLLSCWVLFFSWMKIFYLNLTRRIVTDFSNKQAYLQYLLEESLEIKCILLLSRCKPPWFISEENHYSSCFRIFG